MRKKFRICLFLSSLGGGGAERVALYLLNHLSPEKFEKHLILYRTEGQYLDFLTESVELHEIGFSPKTWCYIPNIRFFLQLNRLLQTIKPDLVLSFSLLPNLMTLALNRFFKNPYKIVCSEHINLSHCLKDQKTRFIKEFFLRRLYPLADSIIAVSNGIKSDLINNCRISPEKIEVIYNPIDIEWINSLLKNSNHIPNHKKKGTYRIISCGRLEQQKNYFCALKAIHRIKDHIDCYLILGEGKEKGKLEQSAATLGIEDKVRFMGFQKNPFSYFAEADVFLLSSTFEGFGIVICEAMVCGVPVVSTDCPSGPSELIKHNFNGLLVPVNNDEAMAAALLKVAQDRPLRQKLIDNGKKTVSRFSVNTIVQEYENLFLSILDK